MENNTTTYKQMYEGNAILYPPNFPQEEPYGERCPLYYYNGMAVEIEETNKLSKDRPTLTWNIPIEYLGISKCTDAEADICLREFGRYIDELNSELYNRNRPVNESGRYYLYRPGGEVLKRNAAYFAECPPKDYENGSGCKLYLKNEGASLPPIKCLCIKMQVQLPKGKIKKAKQMLCHDLPFAVERFVHEMSPKKLAEVAALSEKQKTIRNWLKNSEYCAFIANGSILPRAKGSDRPMEEAVPFISVPEDETEVCGIKGMGIKRGVTVITGGGYSGKSTLLDAIAAGIYDHVMGDGRELCITDESAVTVSAEDGRCVSRVNISPFIKWLPVGDTSDFSTDHASGSTSQAANIMEAIDFGARLLLIDEDRSATNFMIRDRMMKALIEKEPITPFTDRVNELYSSLGVSTILVIGGSGEYLAVADKVYIMEDYLIHDATDSAKKISGSNSLPICTEKGKWLQNRVMKSATFTSYPEGSGSERLCVSDMGFVVIGDERIDLRGLHNIVSNGQKDALGFMLRYLEITNTDVSIDIKNKVDELYSLIERDGVDTVYSPFFTDCERILDLPRKHELLALISRMRNTVYIRK